MFSGGEYCTSPLIVLSTFDIFLLKFIFYRVNVVIYAKVFFKNYVIPHVEFFSGFPGPAGQFLNFLTWCVCVCPTVIWPLSPSSFFCISYLNDIEHLWFLHTETAFFAFLLLLTQLLCLEGLLPPSIPFSYPPHALRMTSNSASLGSLCNSIPPVPQTHSSGLRGLGIS